MNLARSVALLVASASASVSIAAPAAPRQAGGSVARHVTTPVATHDRNGIVAFAFPTMPTAFVTLRPTTTADLYDAADITRPGTGRLSLREAFALANQLDVEVAIVLQRGAVYRLERCGVFDALEGSVNELVHTANKSVTVNGNAATIFQDCDGAAVIVQKGGDQLVNLVDLTIAGGRSKHVPAGAVWNSGTGEVRVTNAVLIDNQASYASAGPSAGAVVTNGDMNISGATFANNVSDQGVGAVAAVGAVKSVKSTFYGNVGHKAGAIVGGRTVVPASPFGPPPFTGRTPDGVTLLYSTLAQNSHPQLAATDGGLTSFGSVIAGAGAGPQCGLTHAATKSLGANFVSGGGGCGIGKGAGDRANGADPRLVATTGMKQVDVFVPAVGSPLLNAIPADACVPPDVRAMLPVYSGGSSDQLGVRRPQGSGCDIGAVEAIRPGSLVRQADAPPLSDLPLATRWAPAPIDASGAAGAIRVTTLADTVGEGGTSLRDAIARANQSEQPSTIALEPGRVYRLDRCVAPQAALDNVTNDLVYFGARSLTVVGNGSTILQTCDGSGVLAIFADTEVTLRGVTISGGRSVIHPGGGIYFGGAGVLRLESSWVTDNSTVAAGGGIASFGDVILLDSTISNNHSFEVGGGVIGTADVTAINSSIFDNTADLAIGGIGNHSGKLTVVFSTIAHNTSPNVAVGSIDALGSIIADHVPPAPPPGFGGPPPGVAHDGPPPGPGSGPLPAAARGAPPRPPGPPADGPPGAGTVGGGPPGGGPPRGGPPGGGFPTPANCGAEHAGALLDGNVSSDTSCGFHTVVADVRLVPNRSQGPTRLIPRSDSPAVGATSASACASYRLMTDQSGEPRGREAVCTSGAVAGPAR